jgi:peptidoglycan/xylan/chitin deacetylase (PgdA/CDA1 family)
VRETIKNLIASVLYRTGLLVWVLKLKLRDRAVVLMYHRVLPRALRDDSFSATSIMIAPELFDVHMQTIKRYLVPLSPHEFFQRLNGAQNGFSRHCLVTFDDGWHDNHLHALPILRRRQVPALVFVATGYVDGDGTFWQERLARTLHVLWRAHSVQDELYGELGVAMLLKQNAAEVKVYIRSAITGLKSRGSAEIEKLMERAGAALRSLNLPVDELGEDRFMTWDEVRQLSASGVVTIGSHAHTHTPMPKLSPQEVERELSESRRIIHEQLGGSATPWFAYPNGDHHDVSRKAAANVGYSMAVTTESGLVAVGDDPMQLRRINVHDRAAPTTARLLCRIVGLF